MTKPNAVIAAVVTTLLLAALLTFYLCIRRLGNAPDEDDDEDEDDGESRYRRPATRAYLFPAAAAYPAPPPPAVHAFRGEPGVGGAYGAFPRYWDPISPYQWDGSWAGAVGHPGYGDARFAAGNWGRLSPDVVDVVHPLDRV
ncbi:hypothetical protein F4802DRAFT_379573 [Xylaria palmicola]|nr:hypothetical protein F4802DRAFT_379573 [Xylaria palmicola]